MSGRMLVAPGGIRTRASKLEVDTDLVRTLLGVVSPSVTTGSTTTTGGWAKGLWKEKLCHP